MNNHIGPEIRISTQDPKTAALFYINHLGFEVTEFTPDHISLNGRGLNLLLETGPPSVPVLTFTDPDPSRTTQTLLTGGCHPLDAAPASTRPALQDPFGLAFHIVSDRT